MSKRFGAAVFAAIVLHAALIGLSSLRRRSEAPRVLDASHVARASEVEISMLTQDDPPSRALDDAPSSVGERSDRAEPAGVARLRGLSQRTGSAPDAAAKLDDVSAPDGDAALAELGSGLEPEASPDGASETPSGARQRVDLGLDGSVLRQAMLEARQRPARAQRAPRRKPLVVLSHWSEGAVRALAQKSAPPEGRALLTLEWDSKGQLLSVTASAASSRTEEWQQLAQGLGTQLAARANASAPGAGLRLVYLIKSDLVVPESKRSLLPSAKYASAEQLRADNLPPANSISLGVKADNSAATTRVVSVELVRSDAL